MAATVTKVVVFDRDLYKPGHLVHKWVFGVTLMFTANAISYAPRRSGELKAGIHGDVEGHPEVKKAEGFISSDAPHSLYVLGGTTGPIFSHEAWASGGDIEDAYEMREIKNKRTGKWEWKRVGRQGMWLAVGKQRLYPPVVVKHSVAGQRANNFLIKAWKRTAWNHKPLRGNLPATIRFD